jgi:hypothetical protein
MQPQRIIKSLIVQFSIVLSASMSLRSKYLSQHLAILQFIRAHRRGITTQAAYQQGGRLGKDSHQQLTVCVPNTRIHLTGTPCAEKQISHS